MTMSFYRSLLAENKFFRENGKSTERTQNLATTKYADESADPHFSTNSSSVTHVKQVLAWQSKIIAWSVPLGAEIRHLAFKC